MDTENILTIITHGLFGILSFIGMFLTVKYSAPYYIFLFINSLCIGVVVGLIIGNIAANRTAREFHEALEEIKKEYME